MSMTKQQVAAIERAIDALENLGEFAADNAVCGHGDFECNAAEDSVSELKAMVNLEKTQW